MGLSFFDEKNWGSWMRVTYYATNTWKNYSLDYAHSHDRLELVYVYYGELTVRYCVDGQWHEYTLYSNDYALIDVDILHTMHTGKYTTQVFSVELKLIPDTLSELQYTLKHLIYNDAAIGALFSQNHKVLRLSDSGHVIAIIRELQACMERSEHTGNYFDLLISLLFAAIGNDHSKQRYPHRSGIRHLRKAAEYVSSNFHHDINCREIAAQAIAVAAEFGGELLADRAETCVSELRSALEDPGSSDPCFSDANQWAIVALGKLCFYCGAAVHSLDAAYRFWLTQLPVEDPDLLELCVTLVCRLLEKGEPAFLGETHQNVPRILQVLCESLGNLGNAAVEQQVLRMIKTIEMQSSPELLNALWNVLGSKAETVRQKLQSV